MSPLIFNKDIKKQNIFCKNAVHSCGTQGIVLSTNLWYTVVLLILLLVLHCENNQIIFRSWRHCIVRQCCHLVSNTAKWPKCSDWGGVDSHVVNCLTVLSQELIFQYWFKFRYVGSRFTTLPFKPNNVRGFYFSLCCWVIQHQT